MLVDARDVVEDLDIPATFDQISTVTRFRKKKRQFSYEGKDEPIEDPKQRFKITFYLPILDTAISSVKERFNQLQEINSKFGFLYHIDALETNQQSMSKNNALNLKKLWPLII
nr:unnamed protein product [Callosobruchus analis]